MGEILYSLCCLLPHSPGPWLSSGILQRPPDTAETLRSHVCAHTHIRDFSKPQALIISSSIQRPLREILFQWGQGTLSANRHPTPRPGFLSSDEPLVPEPQQGAAPGVGELRGTCGGCGQRSPLAKVPAQGPVHSLNSPLTHWLNKYLPMDWVSGQWSSHQWLGDTFNTPAKISTLCCVILTVFLNLVCKVLANTFSNWTGTLK